MGRHTPKRSLVDLPFRCSGERHAVVFEFDHRRRRLLAHETDRFLVAKPVRPFYGVIHVPSPVVFSHVGQSGTHAALRGHGMGTRREDLSHAGSSLTRFCKA